MKPLVAALLALAACGGHPSESDCARAVDHMIAIMTAPPVAGGGTPPQEAQTASELWKKTFTEKDPTRATMIDTCRTRMAGGHISCILEASDEASLAKCFSD